MKSSPQIRSHLSAAEHTKRKRYLFATLVTCLALAMIGGSVHVVMLGAHRMAEMRSKVTYDIKDTPSHVRAAGEDAVRRAGLTKDRESAINYTNAEAATLLTPEQWREMDTSIIIPAGPFTMGTNRDLSDEQDHPEHTVVLPAYHIDKYPVINAQYARFVASSGYRPPDHWISGKVPNGLELHPVTMVSWYNAKSYCAWAGKRLPSEQEWEKAARGSDGRRWPWGNDMKADNLNTYYNVGSTTVVTAYPHGASPYGVMDMSGNVSEWTADDFQPYPDTDAPKDLFKAKVGVAASATDQSMKVVDLIATDAQYKVMRAGSWKSDPFSTATYHRNYSLPHYASDFYGFRCAQDVK